MKKFAKKVKLLDDYIWYGVKCQKLSYPKEGNDKCFEVEEKSFWFQHRNSCILELIKKYPPAGGGPILDVGGGNGFVAKAMLDAGWQVILVEPGQAGVINAKKRGVENIICGTIESSGFKKNSVPAIGVFDVVEHIKEDLQFMKRLVEVLKPRGFVYLTVPAHMILWSFADQYAGHFRRYSPSGLSKIIQDAGLKIQFMTSNFFWLLFPVLFLRVIPYWLRWEKAKNLVGNTIRSEHSLPWAIAAIANAANRWELKMLSRGKPLPLGSSLLCAAQKK